MHAPTHRSIPADHVPTTNHSKVQTRHLVRRKPSHASNIFTEHQQPEHKPTVLIPPNLKLQSSRNHLASSNHITSYLPYHRPSVLSSLTRILALSSNPYASKLHCLPASEPRSQQYPQTIPLTITGQKYKYPPSTSSHHGRLPSSDICQRGKRKRRQHSRSCPSKNLSPPTPDNFTAVRQYQPNINVNNSKGKKNKRGRDRVSSALSFISLCTHLLSSCCARQPSVYGYSMQFLLFIPPY